MPSLASQRRRDGGPLGAASPVISLQAASWTLLAAQWPFQPGMAWTRGRATREGAMRSSNLRGPVKQACKTLAWERAARLHHR